MLYSFYGPRGVMKEMQEMATKQSVLNLVKKLGCEIDIERDYIGVMAPKGKVFGDHMHYSGYEVSRDFYTKAEVWNNLASELSSMRYCENANCNDGCAEYNKANA